MELREYIKIINKYKLIFWSIVILCALSALIWTKIQPKSYLASNTYTVNKTSALLQKDASFYQFENYYNVQSSGLFSQIVTNWFESPSLVKEIYENAGIPVPAVSQKKLSKTFKAIREEPATINVSVTGSDKEELITLLNSASEVLQQKTNGMSKNSENVYELAKFTPIVNDNSPNLILNTIIGLFAGIFLAIILAMGLDYFKSEK